MRCYTGNNGECTIRQSALRGSLKGKHRPENFNHLQPLMRDVGEKVQKRSHRSCAGDAGKYNEQAHVFTCLGVYVGTLIHVYRYVFMFVRRNLNTRNASSRAT